MSEDECCQDRTRCTDNNNRDRHCLIVCGSHKNTYSRRVFLSHQLQKIICFTGTREKQREREGDILLGDERVRGLCLPRAAVTPRWGSWACPPVHLGGCIFGQEARRKNPRGLNETHHVIERESNVTDSGASSGGNMWIQTVSIRCWIDSRLKPLLAKILPENKPLLSA